MLHKASLFSSWKEKSLDGVDLSRKGSVDEPILHIIQFINDQENYFTTSSCSGRVCVYEENPEINQKKKGCKWLFTTHHDCSLQDIEGAVEESCHNAYIKFEPFILHVQCKTIPDAQAMHAEAVASGYRNSGITLGKKGKIIVAVRSTHSLEVPLTSNGRSLVSTEYLQHLTELCNNKMKDNLERIQRFYTNVCNISTKQEIDTNQKKKKNKKAQEERPQSIQSPPKLKAQNTDSDIEEIEDCLSNFYDDVT